MNSEIFKRMVSTNADIISSIDHPYTSPPSHIFDAHNYLMRKYGNKILICNWDVSLPGDRTYRYDLITDTGLTAKLPSLYHYSIDDYYCNQAFKKIPLSSLNQCAKLSLNAIQTRCGLPKERVDSIRYYCDLIFNLTQSSYDPTPWKYTKQLLVNFYRYVGRDDMANFINSQYYNYWQSEIMTKWIPWCINNIGGELSINNLTANGVILRTPFRVNNKTAMHLDLDNGLDLIKSIIKGEVIPSFDIFLWSLYAAGIKHYGNDFGFFSRLANYLNRPEINDYQVSNSGEDAINIITLEKDYGVLLETKNANEFVQSQKPYQSSKASRINSLFAGTVLGGNLVIDFLKHYQRGQKGIVVRL